MTTRKKQPAPEVSVIGLDLPEDLTEEAWFDVERDLGHDARTSAFKIGDWLVHAENPFDDGHSKGRYVQAEEITGLANGTLRNYAWVARCVPTSRRRDTLTFGHHQAVAGLDPDDQVRLLDAASTNAWTLAKLRAEAGVESVDLTLKGVPREIAESWQQSAKDADQPLWRWLYDQIENARQRLEQAAELAVVEDVAA